MPLGAGDKLASGRAASSAASRIQSHCEVLLAATGASERDLARRDQGSAPTLTDGASFVSRLRLACLAALLSIVLGWPSFAPGPTVSAHAELDRAEPPPDALLAVPPRTLELWMTEAVAVGGGSPSVRVLDEAGRELAVSDMRVAGDDPRHITARLSGVGGGTYTVVWTVRSAADGHTLTGSYAFRVGGGRAPGAATTQGETPRLWAVITRWLTFLGAALVAAGFAADRLLFGPTAGAASLRRRLWLCLIGATIALIATLSEPALQTLWPPAGTLAPRLADAIAGLPTAWWIRPVALVAALALTAFALAISSRRQLPAPLSWAAAGAGLAAVLGLSFTSHAAARTTWREVAIGSNVLHQWAVALWVGGLAHLAIWWPTRRSVPDAPALPVRCFSRFALALALVGIGTGIVNAGLVLPTLQSLWSSRYGNVVLIKLAILVPVLALATFHRAALRTAAERLGGRLRQTVRAEAMLATLVLLAGASLALLAPPQARSERQIVLDLAQPAVGAPAEAILAHLQLEPAKPGAGTAIVLLTGPDGATPNVEPPALVRLRFESLEQPIRSEPVEAHPNADGSFVTTKVMLSVEGWWRIEVTLRWLGLPDVVLPYYVLLPDPNLHGLDAVRNQPTDSEAEAVYARGTAAVAALHRVRYRQLTSDGNGLGVVALHEVNDGADGSPPGYRLLIPGRSEAVVLGTRGWSWRPTEGWTTFEAFPMVPPSRWSEEFEGATGFRLGNVEEGDGELCQIVTFVVPTTAQRAVAWYVWWVGQETGQLRREVMISRLHYMVSDFYDFDAPLVLQPPTLGHRSPAQLPA